MSPSDKQQQQQQQQQQQHKGIIDISTIHNVMVEEGKSHQNEIGEQDNNNNDERVVGINETSGLEKARRLRAVLGSKACRVRALRLRMRSSSAKSSSSGARSSSTEKIIANTARLLSKYSSQQEKNKEVLIAEPFELGIESSLLSGGYNNTESIVLSEETRTLLPNNYNYYYTDHNTMALSPSSSLRSGDNNNNHNNNNNNNNNNSHNNNSTELILLLSSAETTQEKITKEMTLLLESSGQASIELVDHGCDIVKAAIHSIEVFLMGPTTTNKESTAYNNNIPATTHAGQKAILGIAIRLQFQNCNPGLQKKSEIASVIAEKNRLQS